MYQYITSVLLILVEVIGKLRGVRTDQRRHTNGVVVNLYRAFLHLWDSNQKTGILAGIFFWKLR